MRPRMLGEPRCADDPRRQPGAAQMLNAAPTGPDYDPGNSSVAQPLPVSVTVVHVQGTITPAVDEVRRALAADPCSFIGHRPAHLARGGVACGVCGAPL